MPEEGFLGSQLLAVEKRKDGDDAALIDVERGSVERHEWIYDVLDLISEKPDERVLPPHAVGISVLDPHDELARLENRAGRAAGELLPLRRKSRSVAIGDSLPEGLESWLCGHAPRLAEIDA